MCCYCCCCCCWSDGIFPIVMEMMVEWIQFSLVTVPPPFSYFSFSSTTLRYPGYQIIGNE
jgi:hypothetical protein